MKPPFAPLRVGAARIWPLKLLSSKHIRILDNLRELERNAGIFDAVEKARGLHTPHSFDEYDAGQFDKTRRKVRNIYFSVDDLEIRKSLISLHRKAAVKSAEHKVLTANLAWEGCKQIVLFALVLFIFFFIATLIVFWAGLLLGFYQTKKEVYDSIYNEIQSIVLMSFIISIFLAVDVDAVKDKLKRDREAMNFYKLCPEYFNADEEFTGIRDETFNRQSAYVNLTKNRSDHTATNTNNARKSEKVSPQWWFVLLSGVFFPSAFLYSLLKYLTDATWIDKHPYSFIYLLGSASALALVIFLAVFIYPLSWFIFRTTKSNVYINNLEKIPTLSRIKESKKLLSRRYPLVCDFAEFIRYYLFVFPLLSWIGLILGAGRILMLVINPISEMLTSKPEAIKLLMLPLYNNPNMSREAVWAYTYALKIKSDGNLPDKKYKKYILSELNDLLNYHSDLDRQAALMHLKGLNVIDDNIISSALHKIQRKEDKLNTSWQDTAPNPDI